MRGFERTGTYGPIVRTVIVTAVGGVLIWGTWLTWPDPIIDVGRELYVAWRLAEGEALYREVAYFNGPLSPYVNAVAFRLFGVGIHTLMGLNAVILALITAAIYRMSALLRGPWAGVLASVVFLVLFPITTYTGAGGYSYLAPYSHEATHGLLLCLLLILALARVAREGRGLFVPGLVTGALLLTKPEMALAGVVTATVGLALILRSRGGRGGAVWTLAVGTVVPPGMAALALTPALGLAGAVSSISSPYVYAADPEIRGLPFYAMVAGTTDVAGNVTRILLGALVYLALLGVPWLVFRRISAWRTESGVFHRLTAIVAFLAGALVAVTVVSRVWWAYLFVLLPLFCLLLALTEFAGRPLRLRAERGDSIVGPLLAVLALTLLAKIRLSTVIYGYGFVLAVPAVIALVLMAFYGGSDALEPGARTRYRSYVLGALAMVLTVHLGVAARIVTARSAAVGQGSDRFFTDPGRAGMLFEMTDAWRDRLRPGQTLSVLPEGGMVNYLLRVPSSVPWVTLLPPELAMFGGHRVAEHYRAHPPDWILIWKREQASMGGSFGDGYGEELRSWIDRTYSVEWTRMLPVGLDHNHPEDPVPVTLLRRAENGPQ